MSEIKKINFNSNVGIDGDISTKSNITAEGNIKAKDFVIEGDGETADLVEVELGQDAAVGGYKTGDVIAAGTSFTEILKKLLQKAIPATYTKPTISLTNNGGTSSGNIEAGSMITPKLKASYDNKDAGGLTRIEIKKDGTSVVAGTSTTLEYDGSNSQFVIGDDTVTFTATATYKAAPVKTNNLGDESKENWFAGGAVTSSNYSITGKRKLFYGTGTGALPKVDSSVVRGLSKYKLAPINGEEFTVNFAVGQQYVIIAYPSNLNNISKIRYEEGNDDSMVNNFTKSTTDVADFRGGQNGLKEYKVYTYALNKPTEAAMTFKVTI